VEGEGVVIWLIKRLLFPPFLYILLPCTQHRVEVFIQDSLDKQLLHFIRFYSFFLPVSYLKCTPTQLAVRLAQKQRRNALN